VRMIISRKFIIHRSKFLVLFVLVLVEGIKGLSANPNNFANMPTSDQQPLLTFGVIADIQYAPIPDGYSFAGTPRYYRHSLVAARHAAEHFQEKEVPLVVNLGDIIDGKCQEIEVHCREELQDFVKPPEGSDPGHDAVNDVLQALSPYRGKIMHTYGNHELYNLSREDIGSKLNIPFVREPCGDLVGYYSYDSPCKSFKFIVLDSYDIAMMGRSPDSSLKYKEATTILKDKNPNFPHQENSPAGLKGVDQRFVAFGGAVGQTQLDWLRSTLETAKNDDQTVIILSHQSILPGSSGNICLIWNYSDVLEILREYSDTIAVALAGHAHKGGYLRDESGIHFRVIEAALESKAPIKTYGFVDVYEDQIHIRGFGDCASGTYSLDHLTSRK
jgi:manganese-dependent ADP-ribose/CDP-alcohol diphosphatase